MRKVYKIVFLLGFAIISTNIFGQYQKVKSNNLDIYYRIFGDGQPLLIIGGGPGDNSNRYVSLCELLSDSIQCILPDQRGTGKSVPQIYDSTTIDLQLTIDDFEVIRKELGFEKWNILGFSYGGYIASYYAFHYPESINSIILLESMGLNTNAFGYFSDNIQSRLQDVDIKKIQYWSDSERLTEDKHKAIVEIIKAKMPGYFYDREKALLYQETMKESDFSFEIGKFIWPDIINFNILEKENNFLKPVLILQGRQDPLGEGVAITLSKYYKKSKLIFIEKAGHYSWIEQPEAVKNNIETFINN